MRVGVTITGRQISMLNELKKYYNTDSSAKALECCLEEMFYKHYVKEKIECKKEDSKSKLDLSEPDDRYY